MTVDWIPGAIKLTNGAQSGAQDHSYPARLVLHTTEGGGTVESLANFYRTSTYWPHFTADLLNKKLAQHLPLSVAGRALSHSRPTQTNGANCIQVEIIGRAAESHTWPPHQVEWLGHALAPVLDALSIQRTAPAFVAGGASASAPQRMTDAEWRVFNGVCGHQHVPQNDHWDPGMLDITTFLAATETDMPLTTADLDAIKAVVDASIKHALGGYNAAGQYVDGLLVTEARKSLGISSKP